MEFFALESFPCTNNLHFAKEQGGSIKKQAKSSKMSSIFYEFSGHQIARYLFIFNLFVCYPNFALPHIKDFRKRGGR